MAHRQNNAQVHVFQADNEIIGMAMMYDLEEPPTCHFLMEFLIDKHPQNKGYAQDALQCIVASYAQNPRFPVIELAVDRTNHVAMHVYRKAGFVNSGYVDPTRPHLVHMVYRFEDHS